MALAVHSSLSALGWVEEGPATVIRALQETIGSAGTLMMPAATPQCAELPVFEGETTPTRMGAIPETFRTWPGTVRSDHPLESVSANGPLAGVLVRDHPRDFSEGPGSPWGHLHTLSGWVLLLGVGFNRCTALHYVESLTTNRRTKISRYPVRQGANTTWVEARDMADDNGTLFPQVGERFRGTGAVKQGTIGEAPSMLFRVNDLVDFAVPEFERILPTR